MRRPSVPGPREGPACPVNRVRWSLGLSLGGILLMATTGGAGVLDASWTAPTTNIDESPLMDFVAYRVYFGPSDRPCPGPSLLLVGFPPPTPPFGATQTVTVRFTPSAPAMATANVNFTANEDTVSRIVTGDGTDTIPPTLAITSPTGNAAYTTSNPLLTLGGTSSDNTGVTQVTWANDRSGGGTASGTTSWVASGIALQFGANVVTVTARDAAGNTATASLTVTLAGILTFTNDPLTAQDTVIRTVHIMELRAAIDGVRVARELATFDWTDPALIPGSTPVKAIHVAELRTALSHAYEAAGLTPPRYSDPTPIAGLTVIKATDLNELRTFVRALE